MSPPVLNVPWSIPPVTWQKFNEALDGELLPVIDRVRESPWLVSEGFLWPIVSWYSYICVWGLQDEVYQTRNDVGHTRKSPSILDGDHWSPSTTTTRTILNTNSKFQLHSELPVHLWILLSSVLEMKTAPDLINVLRSESLSFFFMRGMMPSRAAWKRRWASSFVAT